MHTLDHALTQVTDRIQAARADGTPLRIRGGGSKDFYGQSLQGEVLDSTGLNGIVSYEPSELVVTVGAGTPLAELEALLAEQGQCLPFEPPHFGWSGTGAGQGPATVGGMVASGLAGPARASVGGVRDYVLGLKMVNGKGEHLTFGGQVIKNVAGYDVSRLMVGALGTLGLITEVSLKVLPVAPAEATLVFALDQAAALEQLQRWGGQPLPLNASCWVHDDSDPAVAARDLLFVRLRGAMAAVEAACRSMLKELPGSRMDSAQASADWTLCRNQQLPFFSAAHGEERALWRLSVAPTAPVLDLPWAPLVEWHGALRWLWAPTDAAEQLQAAARAAGGFATNFVAAHAHSIRVVARFDSQNGAEMATMRRLKASFDPQGIFNPGRLFAEF
ncbi:MAG: glycolate oxidase subunit GlcE [Burkholderiales bacterium RIFCSPLOWO2_12_FULL_61_40]|nr:MAG: glycolate oxidase subunit GlcE [Burkholderiales bacterium RIFCSPLOWO2_12_FULL_61_40]